jgi:phosphoglycolate phosphatase-like HAD superfamily hydrolase
LVIGFALAIAVIQLVVIAWARQVIRLAADELIDTGTGAGTDTEVTAEIDARMRELCGERERRRAARTLRDAIIDARRPRSSNPLVLAGRTTTLTKGAAQALIVDHALATRIATTLAESDADPRAILAVRNVLFPQPGAALSVEEQERAARHELVRAARLLGIGGDHQAGSVSR